jgi:GH15 family glucan-1,4-alpha-glucosidase
LDDWNCPRTVSADACGQRREHIPTKEFPLSSNKTRARCIQDHAIIGDLHTVALVDTNGTVDLMCLPRIDGPSVFAALLDPGAGSFSVDIDIPDVRRRQLYVPDTNVLISGFHGNDAVVELTDFMVVGQGEGEPILIRKLESVRGTVKIKVRCAPRFNYARSAHTARRSGDGIDFLAQDASVAIRLLASIPMKIEKGCAVARFDLAPREPCYFVLGSTRDGLPVKQAKVAEFGHARLHETVAYWRTWAARSTYRGRWRGPVTRSILALKLLTSEEHGSMAAAATFGLPEVPGGERNWDYRYSWIRDASFATYAFIRLGYVDEAVAFMHWIGRCMNRSRIDGPLRPFYRLDGTSDMPELILENFAGYRDSRPVLIGNAASDQLQLDVYGALLDAIYLTSKYGGAMSFAAWDFVSHHIEWL